MTPSTTTNETAPAFVAPATTQRANQMVRMRAPGSGKRVVVRVMRPTLAQLQARLRRNRKALTIVKAGSPYALQLKMQQNKIVEYLNALHAAPVVSKS